MKQFLRYAILTAALTFTASSAWSQDKCVQLFDIPFKVIDQINLTDAPVYQGSYEGKTFPSILVNNRTYDKMQNALSKTLGITVIHQTGHGNDHGMLRLGDYFIDRDLPGYRSRGEINKTGIAWASVKEYLVYAEYAQTPYNRIEVLFDLNDAEYETATAYQKMRRAGLIRPDFTYGTDTNPRDLNNRLDGGGEICFSFSCGTSASAQIYQIKRELNKIGVQDVNAFMANPEVVAFVKEARNKILRLGYTVYDLNPDMMADNRKAPAVGRLLNLKKGASRTIALNWIVGLAFTSEYNTLLNTLGINGSSDFSNISSPRAIGMLVYDAVVSDADFMSPDYQSTGAFSTYEH